VPFWANGALWRSEKWGLGCPRGSNNMVHTAGEKLWGQISPSYLPRPFTVNKDAEDVDRNLCLFPLRLQGDPRYNPWSPTVSAFYQHTTSSPLAKTEGKWTSVHEQNNTITLLANKTNSALHETSFYLGGTQMET